MMMKKLRFMTATLASMAVLAGGAGQTLAQEFPNKPVRAIIGYPPGAAVDNNVRVIGKMLSDLWGQPVVVENRPGAGSTIGTAAVARAAPDGYTFLLAAPAHAINPTLYKKLPYDAERAFAPVAHIADSPLVLMVNSALPVNSVKELIAMAKEKPGKLNYGSSGNGTSAHLGAALFNMMAGVDITHVPFSGGGPAMTALLAGNVDIVYVGINEALGQLKGGSKVKALGVTTAVRAPTLPDVPTIAEAGIPGYEVSAWYAIFVPAGTPRDIVTKFNRDINKVLQSAEAKERYSKMGFTIVGGTPEQLAAFDKAEVEKWRKVITHGNIRVD